MTLCRRGRSVLGFTLGFRLVAGSIISAAPPRAVLNEVDIGSRAKTRPTKKQKPGAGSITTQRAPDAAPPLARHSDQAHRLLDVAGHQQHKEISSALGVRGIVDRALRPWRIRFLTSAEGEVPSKLWQRLD